jgi:hypothetical protein
MRPRFQDEPEFLQRLRLARMIAKFLCHRQRRPIVAFRLSMGIHSFRLIARQQRIGQRAPALTRGEQVRGDLGNLTLAHPLVVVVCAPQLLGEAPVGGQTAATNGDIHVGS